MFDKEITVVVLDKNENVLGFLSPRHTRISETNKLYQARTITLTCDLIDENNQTDLSLYDTMLSHGNKIWREGTTDGDSCLFVLNDDKSYDEDMTEVTITGTEVSIELGKCKLIFSDSFSWIVNEALISSKCGELYDAGEIDGPTTATTYSGVLTPLQMINEIQNSTGGEFRYRYIYDSETDMIKRYIDFYETVGVTHEQVIRVGETLDGIEYSEDESNVAIAAGPTGKPSSSTDDFNQRMKAFWDLAITKGQTIKLWVATDSSGNTTYGPDVQAPYAKVAGQGWVVCDEESELVAAYTHIQSKAGTTGELPRIHTFTTSEKDAINIYWECVENIRDHLQPDVSLGGDIINLSKIEGLEDVEYYNVGDIVYIQLRSGGVVQCRVTSTTKDPREPASERFEISTYKSTFMQDFFTAKFKNPDSVVFE